MSPEKEKTVTAIQQILLNMGKEKAALRLYEHNIEASADFKKNMLTEDEIYDLALDVLYDCLNPHTRAVVGGEISESENTAITLLKFVQNIPMVCTGPPGDNLKIAVLSAAVNWIPKSDPAREIIEKVLSVSELNRQSAISSHIDSDFRPVPVARLSMMGDKEEIEKAIKILEDAR